MNATKAAEKIPAPVMEKALHYARCQVRYFSKKPLPWLDKEVLVPAAELAVWQAAETWKPDGGKSFHSYSTDAVRYAIQREIRNQSPLTVTSIKRRRALVDAGKKPEGWMLSPLSLERFSVRQDDEEAIELLVDPCTAYSAVEARQIVRDLLPRLDFRRAQVLRMSFLEGKSERQIAREIGLSNTYVGLLRQTGLKKLRALVEG